MKICKQTEEEVKLFWFFWNKNWNCWVENNYYVSQRFFILTSRSAISAVKISNILHFSIFPLLKFRLTVLDLGVSACILWLYVRITYLPVLYNSWPYGTVNSVLSGHVGRSEPISFKRISWLTEARNLLYENFQTSPINQADSRSLLCYTMVAKVDLHVIYLIQKCLTQTNSLRTSQISVDTSREK